MHSFFARPRPPRFFRSLLAFVVLSLFGMGCGAASEPPPRAGNRSPTTGAGGSATGPLAPLRPPGADAPLEALQAHPGDPRAYARAAVLYADTRSGGMTLLYGLTAVAVTGDSPVADDLLRVLRENVSVRVDGSSRRISTRLAPGATPTFPAPNGGLRAPLAYLFEQVFGISLLPFEGEWTLGALIQVWSTYAQLVRRGTPLDDHVELHRWLLALDDAGQLPGFVALAFGPSLGVEPSSVGEARAWIERHPFRPTRPVLPDDLLRFR